MENNEIKELIKRVLSSYKEETDTGIVISSNFCTCKVHGLKGVFLEELLNIGKGIKGIVISLNEYTANVLTFEPVKAGDKVYRTKKKLSIKIGTNIIGKILNGFGECLNGIIVGSEYEVNKDPKTLLERETINRQIITGIKYIDFFMPIGYGQRVLFLGDSKTGKSSMFMDIAINNRKANNIVHIYISICKSQSFNSYLIKELYSYGVPIIFVIVKASDSPAAKYLAPFVGISIGEFFREIGYDAMVYIDDLNGQARSYREINLLLGNQGGRERYPGDLFAVISRLLERASNSDPGSLSILCVVETKEGDVSEYLPTSVLSITDGQIIFDSKRDKYPLIDINSSVSRVGGIQDKRLETSDLKIKLNEYLKNKELLQLGDNKHLNIGREIEKLLQQEEREGYDVYKEIFLLKVFEKMGRNINFDIGDLMKRYDQLKIDSSVSIDKIVDLLLEEYNEKAGIHK